jgi:hypothetical protein
MSDTLARIREDGVGNGFTVLDPKDGFRQDGKLWFGTCAVCNGRVTNSRLDGVWTHYKTITVSRHANGSPLRQDTQTFDYCPTARGEE